MSRRADIWTHIRGGEPFTIRALAEALGVPRPTARPYVHALARAGFIARVDQTAHGDTVYQLAHDAGPDTPRYNSVTGTVDAEPSGRYRAWQSARVLRRFSVIDLQATAECSRACAIRYTQALIAAGYVRMTRDYNGNTRTRRQYQLVRDPGPLPLRHNVASNTLTDPNTEEVFSL